MTLYSLPAMLCRTLLTHRRHGGPKAAFVAALAGFANLAVAGVTPPPTRRPTPAPVPEACDVFSPAIAANVLPDFHLDNLSLYGCPGGAWSSDPSACLTAQATSPWTASGVPGLVVKVLRRLDGRPQTAYWTRTSADGRFSSTGNGLIEDLQIAGRSINVHGEVFDPVYSPNNKFYAWPSQICPQAPLYDPTLTDVGPDVPASGCTAQDVGVYRSLGSDESGDMLAIQGYTNNNPGNGQPDGIDMPGPGGGFNIGRISGNQMTTDNISVATPNETDYQIAPSGKLVIGRFINGTTQAYRVRVVRPDGHTIDPANAATTGVLCMRGEKANFSYDGRFVAFHHFNDGTGAPQDQGAAPNSANIFIYDLVQHRSLRVTAMKDGNHAYYPHFRADGWLYFLIKGADGVETIAASNAALVLRAMAH